jgi:Uma2 family endonuclease
MRLGRLLGNFIEPWRLGRLSGGDPGIWIERQPDTVRAADIAFISMSRMPPNLEVIGYTEIVPDLVVEIVSPNDTQREVSEKASMWLGFGVRLVWVVQPDTRAVDVYVEGDDKTTIADSDFLDGGDVLPGFRCLVRDIFDS